MTTFKYNKQIIAAIDIGAGLGTKISIADIKEFQTRCLRESLIKREDYGIGHEQFIDNLINILKTMMADASLNFNQLCSIGVSIPGFADDNQNIISCNNLLFLDDTDIVNQLSSGCNNAPVSVINDGDCGALALFNIHHIQLLYWAFGGGWGGSWISAKGNICFPTQNWDKKDKSIHPTNEPGYVGKLLKKDLEKIFKNHNAPWDKFLQNFAIETKVDINKILGPENDPESLRAETCVSGKGLWRIFLSLMLDNEFNSLPEDLQIKLLNPGAAGPVICNLYKQNHHTAKKAISLFRNIFGKAAIDILLIAIKDGAPADIPIFLGGGLARAFDLFAPQVNKILNKTEIKSTIMPCDFLETGQNASIMGAFYLASQNIS